MAKTYDLGGALYNHGDDERCPVCGAQLDGYDDLDFNDGVVQVTHYCECGKTLTFNYYLNNVIAE